MTDEDALLAAIIAEPAEDTPRLVYADWLDEQDREQLPHAAGFAKYIRASIFLTRPIPEHSTAGVVTPPWAPHRAAKLLRYGLTRDDDFDQHMRDRAQAMADERGFFVDARLHLMTSEWGMTGKWRRGFPVRAECPLSTWANKGPWAARRAPFEEVALSEKMSWKGRWVRFSRRDEEKAWRRATTPDGHTWDVEEIAPYYQANRATLPDWLFRHLPTVKEDTIYFESTDKTAQEDLSYAALKWAREDGEVA